MQADAISAAGRQPLQQPSPSPGSFHARLAAGGGSLVTPLHASAPQPGGAAGAGGAMSDLQCFFSEHVNHSAADYLRPPAPAVQVAYDTLERQRREAVSCAA